MIGMRMLGGALIFAGICLLGSATIAAADWAVCVSHGGGQGCRQSKGDAIAAFAGAANVALGIAVQSPRTQP